MLPAVQTAQRSPLDPLPMDDAAWRASLRRVPGETRAQVLDLGYGLLERLVRGGPTTHAALCLRLRTSAAAALLGCIESSRRGLGALAANTSAPADDHRLPQSARMARHFVDHGRRAPEWVGLLALLEEWVWVHDDPRNMPRRPDRRVLERDGSSSARRCARRSSSHMNGSPR